MNTFFYNRQCSDILRNQLIRAQCHSLLKIALKLDQFRHKCHHNKDPIWLLKKAAEDLFVFMDQLQEVSNYPEADRRITSIDFELLAITLQSCFILDYNYFAPYPHSISLIINSYALHHLHPDRYSISCEVCICFCF